MMGLRGSVWWGLLYQEVAASGGLQGSVVLEDPAHLIDEGTQ